MTNAYWSGIYFFRLGLWFRVFGWGLHIKRSAGHVKLFSERYGYRKAWYFLGLRLEVLKPHEV